MENLLKKLEILGTAAKYDVCASSSSTKKFQESNIGTNMPRGICHSFTPDGRCISLFKVLLTNECLKDCGYCQNRCQLDIPRTSFTPEELAKLFIEFYTRNYVEGLFLSSGVRFSANRTLEEMIKTVEILRYQYKFAGYIHLKILPGASENLIKRSIELSNRVSINIEVPDKRHMMLLSKRKNFQTEISSTIATIAANLRNNEQITQTTQYIVGAAGEKDREILQSVNRLYTSFRLKRAYFSAFQPIPGTPLESLTPAPLLRETRLYQMDFLIRQYRFHPDEIVFDEEGNLPADTDPKLAFALKNIHLYPVEVNKATQAELLRVPGIGPVSARRIMKVRKIQKLSDLAQLKNLGVVVKRAAPFLLLAGRPAGKLEDVLKFDRKNGRPAYEQLTIEPFLKEQPT